VVAGGAGPPGVETMLVKRLLIDPSAASCRSSRETTYPIQCKLPAMTLVSVCSHHPMLSQAAAVPQS